MFNSQSKPIFKYHISGLSSALTNDSPLWNLPLLGKDAGGILLHEYFTLAEKFIKSNNYNILKDGLKFILEKKSSGKKIQIKDIQQINIYLEKHGAFYHPARVEVTIKYNSYCNFSSNSSSFDGCFSSSHSIDSTTFFVLNTAVSAPGLSLIDNEYNLLKSLNELDNNFFLPKVFGVKTMTCRGVQISFLLGTWFDGYKEFHLTNDNPLQPIDDSEHNLTNNDCDTSPRVLHIWNSDGSVIPVHPPDYFEIYEKASEILTYFYNIETFEHISLWHHAAGDFVARPIMDRLPGNKQCSDGTIEHFDVKLITVRGYGSSYDSISEFDSNSNENNIEDIYKALLLFFLNLTLRMRIDKIDGTGDICMVYEDVIPFILKGFFRAMESKKEASFFVASSAQTPFIDGFKSYLSQFTHENLYHIFLIMVNDWNPDNPEALFVKKYLKSHSEILFYNIRNIISPVL